MKRSSSLLVVVVVAILLGGSFVYLDESSPQRAVSSSITSGLTNFSTSASTSSTTSSTTSFSSSTLTAQTWSVSSYIPGGIPTGASDSFFPSNFSCYPSVGGFEFQILSDYSGEPLAGATISAVSTLGVDCDGQSYKQVVYIDNFSVGQQGWIMPIYPSNAIAGGIVNITLGYQGMAYTFSGNYPGVGSNCISISLPSGAITNSTVMNGIGSYCFQG